MLQEKYPLTWTFHRNTSRWPHNVHETVDAAHITSPFKEYFEAALIDLPRPLTLSTHLGETIINRFSCRHFKDKPLDLNDLSTLLYYAYGVMENILLEHMEFLERPVPSGGGLYPLELYILAKRVDTIPQGVYHYTPISHKLEQLNEIPLPERYLTELFMGQPYVGEASLVIIITSILERAFWKYGDRGYRYALFEAGHVAQNINLCCSALTLGSVNLGGFFDAEISRLLGIEPESEDEFPLYGIAIGIPASNKKMSARGF